MHLRFALSITLLLTAFSSTIAGAQPTAQAFLQRQHNRAQSVMRRPDGTNAQQSRNRDDLTAMLNQLLDYEELSRRALSDHWEGLNQTQRDTFVNLLRQLVERNYRNNLRSTLDYRIRYVGEQAGSSGATIVITEARSRTQRRQPAVEIKYTMHRQGNAWRVFDVDTDGSQLVATYRRQFNRIIRRHDWDALIQRMRDRLARNE